MKGEKYILRRVIKCEYGYSSLCNGIPDENFEDGDIVEIICDRGKVCTVFTDWEVKREDGSITSVCERTLNILHILPKELFVI